jgi:ribonuclease Z
VPDPSRENAYLLVQTQGRTVLVDCGNSPIQQLQRAGISPVSITDLVITHFHPDHVAAAPLLLMDIWLMGRKEPLTIHGLAHSIDRLKTMMDLYEWSTWPNFYPVVFNTIPEETYSPLIDAEGLRVYGSPVDHMIPSLGLRFEMPIEQKVVAYSSDTEPSQALVSLAKNGDVLIHEATGEAAGHSSAAQAAQVAVQAGVKSLYLIHYGSGGDEIGLVSEAKQVFEGPVYLARELMEIKLA